MKRDPATSKTLLDHKDALDAYVRALLREDEFDLPPEVPPPVVERPAPVSDKVEAPAQQAVVERVAPPQAAAAAATPPPAPAAVDVVPEWGRQRFQAMLFRVAGLTLAVPLVELSGVQVWDEEAVTPMPGHAPWYLGLTDYRGRQVPVVDTALLVLPLERRGGLAAAAERVGRVVFIGDGKWGLACDEVAQVVALNSDEVRWRTSRTRRQWLAGTVIEHMCAIIDPPAFAQMLETGREDAPANGTDVASKQ